MAAIRYAPTGMMINELTVRNSVVGFEAAVTIEAMRLDGIPMHLIAAHLGTSSWDVWKVVTGLLHPSAKVEGHRRFIAYRRAQPYRGWRERTGRVTGRSVRQRKLPGI